MKNLYKIVSAVLLIPLFGIVFLFGWIQHREGYNLIDPTIDTEFSADYSEEKFEKIKIGMDSSVVKKILGIPYGTQNLKEQQTLWYFTGDGKCTWEDFAWIGREIQFDGDGKVNEIIKSVHYD